MGVGVGIGLANTQLWHSHKYGKGDFHELNGCRKIMSRIVPKALHILTSSHLWSSCIQ